MASDKEQTPESAASPPRSAKGSAKRPKSKERKSSGSGKRKGKHSAKKRDEESSAALSLASSGHPEYIIPLVCTTKTQEIFNCRVDVDVTQENPYKLLKKEDILQDLKARAAVSDFHPVKKVVIDYPGEEILLVFDRDFKYGQNFYLVTTEEWKENILNPPAAPVVEQDNKEGLDEEYIYKPPVPKAWISLGSEIEIEEETLKENPMKIKYMISRVRREFGAPVNFGDHNASSVKDGYIECASYEDKHFSIRHKERDTGIQVVPLTNEMSTQTKWTFPRNACTQYAPREFPEEEKETLMSSKSLKEFLNSVSVRLELALQQNEIMNAFYDDWKSLAEDESLFGGKSDSHLKEYQSFTDLHFSKEKTISCINWHPTIHGLLAVSVTEHLSYEDRVNISSKLLLTPSLIIIWSFTDPIHPQLMLECPDDICCFQFCPSDPNIIAGGCINGQIVLWDISAYEEKLHNPKTGGNKNTAPKTGLEPKVSTETHFVRYCAVSSIEHGHKELITDLHWLPDFYEVTRAGLPCENKHGLCIQLVTCSPDCSIMFWDIRSAKPTAQSTQEKRKMYEKQLENPQGVPNTFKHLDLSWKPLIKATLPKIDTSGEYSPMKISLRDEYNAYKMPVEPFKDKSLSQIKEATSEGGINYSSLRATSAKNQKVMDDFNTNLFAGTEDGELVYSNWKMEKDGDTGRMLSQKPFYSYKIHDGTVNTLQRSPFFKDIILTVGGWNFAIWKEGVNSGPILQSCCSQKRYTTGHWSLSRAGVFFIGKEDGNIDIWDLLEKTHEPSQTQNISTALITYIKPWVGTSKQHFLAVSDDYGTLHILEIPWTLRNPSSNELSIVQHYFEREVKHLGFFEQRNTFRVNEKRDLELQELKKKIETIPPQKTKDQMEEEMKKEFEDYLEFEKITLEAAGIKKEI